MILIVGETHDDILYFDSVLANRREETILGRFTVSIGTLFSQEIVIAHHLFSSSLSSAILMNILDNYYVDLVISVGRCMSASDRVKDGDIIVSKKVIEANVDLSMFTEVSIAQIPGFDQTFDVQEDILKYISQGLERRTAVNYHQVTVLSTDNMASQMVNMLKAKHPIFAMDNELVVIDQNSSGVAVASTLKEVPFIVVKVVENDLGSSKNIVTYSNVLTRYIDLGKAVIATINDISRSDILEGE